MSYENNKFDVLDALTVLGFIISYQNYEENIDQNTMQDAIQKAVSSVQEHLKNQDDKIDIIIKMLGGVKNE